MGRTQEPDEELAFHSKPVGWKGGSSQAKMMRKDEGGVVLVGARIVRVVEHVCAVALAPLGRKAFAGVVIPCRFAHRSQHVRLVPAEV